MNSEFTDLDETPSIPLPGEVLPTTMLGRFIFHELGVFTQGCCVGFLHTESGAESTHGGVHFSASIWQIPLSMQAAGSCFIGLPPTPGGLF